MDRREFFRRSALVAAGVVATDQLDILERLFHKRRFFPGWKPVWQPNHGYLITQEMIDDDVYAGPARAGAERMSNGLWILSRRYYKSTLVTID